MRPTRNISTLIQIMAKLRDPNGGCPWDLVQDFQSIKQHTIEEAYEVADAIDRDNMQDLKAELGDLLFQPIYYAQMASENGDFDFGDIVYGICDKLIRRHPHVFGDLDVSDAVDVNANWETIKASERSQKKDSNVAPSVLDDVPIALPALTRANKLAKRAARIGFDWPDANGPLEKVKEEADEVFAEIQSGNHQKIKEEIGDLLFAVASVARKCDVDPEQALADANRKFARRFQYMEQRCEQSGVEIASAGIKQLELFWEEVRLADKD